VIVRHCAIKLCQSCEVRGRMVAEGGWPTHCKFAIGSVGVNGVTRLAREIDGIDHLGVTSQEAFYRSALTPTTFLRKTYGKHPR
jgi:hypothetical protein